MSVYAINGRLLYAGRILPLDKLAQGQAGEVIVKLTKENTIIGHEEICAGTKIKLLLYSFARQIETSIRSSSTVGFAATPVGNMRS